MTPRTPFSPRRTRGQGHLRTRVRRTEPFCGGVSKPRPGRPRHRRIRLCRVRRAQIDPLRPRHLARAGLPRHPTHRLPNPASSDDPDNVSVARQKVVADLQPLLGAKPGQRNFLIFVDGAPNDFRSANTFPLPADDSPAGRLLAGRRLFLGDLREPFHVRLSQAFGKIGVHELFDAFGAVQASAPHYGGGGHCIERQDLMCDPGFAGPVACDSRDYPTISWDDRRGPARLQRRRRPPPRQPRVRTWRRTGTPTTRRFSVPVGTCVPDNVAPETKIKGPKRHLPPDAEVQVALRRGGCRVRPDLIAAGSVPAMRATPPPGWPSGATS